MLSLVFKGVENLFKETGKILVSGSSVFSYRTSHVAGMELAD
jgi:hypothetical protein